MAAANKAKHKNKIVLLWWFPCLGAVTIEESWSLKEFAWDSPPPGR